MEILSPPNRFPGVKNYWFFYGNEGPRQFVITYGTRTLPIRGNGHSGRYPHYGVLFWGYDPKKGKVVKIETSAKLGFPPKELFTMTKEKDNYVFEHDDTKIVFGDEYFPPSPDSMFGVIKFKTHSRSIRGKLFGKKIKGRSYIQKVECPLPFVSWDWLRFQSKDVGEFFKIKLAQKPTMRLNGVVHTISFEAKEGHQHIWGDELDLRVEPYASHAFHFKGLGSFEYVEYFVKVSGKAYGKKIEDYGMAEKARGFIL